MKIGEIRAYFDGLASIPKENIKLASGVVVVDVAKMIETHIETLVANSGNRRFLPYHERLMEVINYIKNKQTNQ